MSWKPTPFFLTLSYIYNSLSLKASVTLCYFFRDCGQGSSCQIPAVRHGTFAALIKGWAHYSHGPNWLPPVFVNNFFFFGTWLRSFIYVCLWLLSALEGQNCIVATNTVWFTKQKIFTLWLFTTFADPWSSDLQNRVYLSGLDKMFYCSAGERIITLIYGYFSLCKKGKS